jgi:hypothetical protein
MGPRIVELSAVGSNSLMEKIGRREVLRLGLISWT